MSLVLTRTQNMRADSNFDKNELRGSRYGALNAFMTQSEDPNGILTQELKDKARISIGSTLETPVIDYDGSISIGNTRTVTISDSENTSRMVSITFATYAWGFTIVPAMFMNNEISMQRDFNTKMLKYIYKFAATLDGVGLTHLSTNKTQQFNNSLLYTVSSNIVKASYLQRESFFGDIDVMMQANDFYRGIDIIGDAGVQSIYNKLRQYGAANVLNKANEFGDKNVYFTNNMTAVNGVFAQGYAVEQGNLGILTRFERESLLRTRSRDGHEWDIVRLPIIDMEVGTYFYDSVGDYNAIAGAATADLTRARKEHYGFAVDVAFVSSYNSALAAAGGNPARPNPIMAFQVLSEGAAPGILVHNTGN